MYRTIVHELGAFDEKEYRYRMLEELKDVSKIKEIPHEISAYYDTFRTLRTKSLVTPIEVLPLKRIVPTLFLLRKIIALNIHSIESENIEEEEEEEEEDEDERKGKENVT